MAQFILNGHYIGAATTGDNTSYVARLVSALQRRLLGCCEQFDQDVFAILLADWPHGCRHISANHIVDSALDTTERWEDFAGKSPLSIAAEIAGLIAAAEIARLNGDDASAARWEATADDWQVSLQGWTVTSTSPRLPRASDPSNDSQICMFQEG
jgi:glycosyl hydrolase family 15